MIVADTNLIAYLVIPGDKTAVAKQVLKRDTNWIVPRLWRSEFENVISIYLHQDLYTLDEGLEFMREAELLIRGGEYRVSSSQVLRMAFDSKCSAYDCEFVVLAQEMGVPLVTSDQNVLRSFSDVAVSMDQFVSK